MVHKHYRELWQARFQKMWKNELEAINFYRRTLRDYQSLLAGTRTERLLQELVQDEARHARIARGLLRLVKEKVVNEASAGEKE
mgnify:FL=1